MTNNATILSRITDAGKFTCIAQNDAGKVSMAVNLVVRGNGTEKLQNQHLSNITVPPSIKDAIRTLTVVQGSSTSFECQSEGKPLPKISWIKDGRKVILNDEHYKISVRLVLLSSSNYGAKYGVTLLTLYCNLLYCTACYSFQFAFFIE